VESVPPKARRAAHGDVAVQPRREQRLCRQGKVGFEVRARMKKKNIKSRLKSQVGETIYQFEGKIDKRSTNWWQNDLPVRGYKKISKAG
jgi:hypothetical protein